MNKIDGVVLETLLENANIGIVIHSWDTAVIYANPVALKLLRLSHDQIIGKRSYDEQWRFIDEDHQPIPHEKFPVSLVKQFKSPVKNQIMGVVDSTHKQANWFMINAHPELAEHIEKSFIVVTFSDITYKKNHFSYKDIVDNAQDIIIVTEADNISSPLGPRIVYVNKAFETLTGYSKDEAIGETPRILQGKDTDRKELLKIRQALELQQAVETTILNYSKTGHPYWLNLNIFPLKNRFGEVTHFAAFERDVTSNIYYAEQLESRNKSLKEIKASLEDLVNEKTLALHDASKQLYHHAYYDALTDIPNRYSFYEQTEKQFSRAKRDGSLLLLGMLDIDFFKNVNDTHGHTAGDELLIEVAKTLSHFFRQEDTFGRYGGEEFAFCIDIANNDQASDVCERIRKRLSAVCITLATGSSLSITASLGAKVFAVDSTTTLNTEIQDVDRALYQAKAQGRDCVVMISSPSQANEE
jgi:diguanylate cyclase (GGDEF)-like protein/PAS domain S-box-containing protein